MAQDILGTQTRSTLRASAHLAAGGSLLFAGAGVGTLAAALLAAPAGAASFTVTNTADSGAGSLRQAILDAEGAAGADTITFAAGATGTITLASDLPTITESLDIVGPGADVLTISGATAFHAFELDNAGTVSISGLTVDGSTSTIGGAINGVFTNLVLDHVILTNNSADDPAGTYGGAVAIDNDDTGTVTISDSAILNNTAGTPNSDLSTGGGLSIHAHDITVTRTEISNNSADVSGGATLVSTTGTTRLIDSTITGNTADAIIGGVGVGGADVAISGTVVDNNSSDLNCGGVYVAAFTSLSISDTSISHNTSTELGGGLVQMAERSGSTPTGIISIDRVTVVDNHGEGIGGLLLGGNSRVDSSTIADNEGGGLEIGPGRFFLPTSLPTSLPGSVFAGATAPSVIQRFDGTSTISNTTISGNTGAGISDIYEVLTVGSLGISGMDPSAPIEPDWSVTITLVHSLIADNGLDAGEDDVAPEATSYFSLIEKPNALLNAGDGTITGVDPGLQPLETISDTVSVVPILFGSPAWNAGFPGFAPPPVIDQRGLPRVVDIIDIGAYEVQEALLVPSFTG